MKNSNLLDGGQVYTFLGVLLHWLEAISLMRKIPEGVHIIAALHSMVMVSDLRAPRTLETDVANIQSGRCTKLLAIVHDTNRFILKNRSICRYGS